jgi:hypothetical protein
VEARGEERRCLIHRRRHPDVPGRRRVSPRPSSRRARSPPRGWWHHSIECTIDKVDWTFIEEHLRVYAAYLWELCTAPVLPFSYAPVAEQIVQRLSELEGQARRSDCTAC